MRQEALNLIMWFCILNYAFRQENNYLQIINSIRVVFFKEIFALMLSADTKNSASTFINTKVVCFLFFFLGAGKCVLGK